MRRLLTVSVLAAVLFGACSSSSGSTPNASSSASAAATPTATAAPTATATPTAKPNLISTITAYAALVTDLNSGWTSASVEVKAAGTDDAKLDPALAKLEKLLADFKTGLSAISFPAAMQSDVDAMAAAAAACQKTVHSMSTTPHANWGSLKTTYNDQATAVSAAADAVKADLYVAAGITPKPSATATPAASASGGLTLAVGGTFHTVTTDGTPAANVTLSKVSFAASYKDPSGVFDDTPLHAGYEYVQVYVTYTALVANVHYNPYDWALIINGVDGDYITAIVLNGPKPKLSFGTLAKGATVSGYIFYEVPKTGPLALSYEIHAHQPLVTYTLR